MKKYKKGDQVVITKNVYYVEEGSEGGLTTEKPEIVIYHHEGEIWTAANDGTIDQVNWVRGDNETYFYDEDWIT